MQLGSDSEPETPRVCPTSGRIIGEPFNPWRERCGFYPPDFVVANVT